MINLQCRIRDAIVSISSVSRGYLWRTANVTLQLALVGTVVFTTMTLIFAATLSESTLDNDFFELLRAKYGSPRILERVKIEDGTYMDVLDTIQYRYGKSHVIRSADASLGSETVMLLKTPKELTERNMNTSQWEIDRTYIPENSYYHTIIKSFLERVLPSPSYDVKVDVLSIGLGGGIVNGFLHYNFPPVNITVVEHSSQVFRMAKKWFRLRIDERQRVEIADGVEFIARSVKKVPPFLDDAAIEGLAKITGKQGVLIMNTASLTIAIKNLEQMIISRFAMAFQECIVEHVEGTLNLVLLCSHQRLDPVRSDAAQFLNSPSS